MSAPKLVKLNGLRTEASIRLFLEFEELLDRIRERAYLLFEARGRWPGASMDDWLRAERELFELPVNELTETEASYEWKISSQGFLPERLNVGVAPYWVTVLGRPDGFERKQLFCRLEMESPIEVDQVKVNFDSGTLRVRMPKVGASREIRPAHPARVDRPSVHAA